MSLAKRSTLLDKLVKKGVLATLKTGEPPPQLVIPTGVDVLDHYLFACGGFPAGKRGITELYGAESSCKSSLVYTTIGEAQSAGTPCFLADTEESLDEGRARDEFGVVPETLGEFARALDPPTMEALLGAFDVVIDALPKNGTALIAWDSFAETTTAEEWGKGLEAGKGYDGRAAIISKALRQLVPKIADKGVALVILNQPRTKIGVMFGDPTTTPGGQAIKSAASLRVQAFAGKQVKRGNDKVGRLVTFATYKTRFSEPRKVRVRFDYSGGFNNEWSTLELAKELGLAPAASKGAKALATALTALAKEHPGFAKRPPPSKSERDNADENADTNEEETDDGNSDDNG